MATYGINFKHDNVTISKEAEFYEIKDGFVRLYHDTGGGCIQEFCAYCADDVSFIALQKEYSIEDIVNECRKIGC